MAKFWCDGLGVNGKPMIGFIFFGCLLLFSGKTAFSRCLSPPVERLEDIAPGDMSVGRCVVAGATLCLQFVTRLTPCSNCRCVCSSQSFRLWSSIPLMNSIAVSVADVNAVPAVVVLLMLFLSSAFRPPLFPWLLFDAGIESAAVGFELARSGPERPGSERSLIPMTSSLIVTFSVKATLVRRV